MLTRQARVLSSLLGQRYLHTSVPWREGNSQREGEHPFKRTLRILRDDFRRFGKPDMNDAEVQRAMMGLFPRHADILIIGGGTIGSAVAYWLKEKSCREGMRIIVVDKENLSDLKSFKKKCVGAAKGSLRHQFTLSENIQMSLFGADFIRTIKKRFGPDADVDFTPLGNLKLASAEGADQLIDNYKLQNQMGANSEILFKHQIEERFPWMNVDDVEVGCLGLEKEGWFDTSALHGLLKWGAEDMGTQYIHGEVVDFLFTEDHSIVIEGMDDEFYEGIKEVVIKMASGEHRTMQFAHCIIAAGSESMDIARLAKIGVKSGLLSIPLPFENRKEYTFNFIYKGDNLGINFPLVLDHSGVQFRREGVHGYFVGSYMPNPEEEEDGAESLDDCQYFDKKIRPMLEHRVPAFRQVENVQVSTLCHEFNYYDETGILGLHPYYNNLYLATGFGAIGALQAPAIGRAVSELILDGEFKTIDLSNLSFDRFVANKPLREITVT